mmetsp:Transcript_82089/g.163484  ORF Transcript_82089/g.163484 Transcript_82089/m.163484 type:complete len:225 (+) Transcript_82089:579-1253(+)
MMVLHKGDQGGDARLTKAFVAAHIDRDQLGDTLHELRERLAFLRRQLRPSEIDDDFAEVRSTSQHPSSKEHDADDAGACSLPTPKVELWLLNCSVELRDLGDQYALEVEGLLHDACEVVIIVEPLWRARVSAILQALAENLEGQRQQLKGLSEDVTQLELKLGCHVHEHLSSAGEHLLERLRRQVEGEARVEDQGLSHDVRPQRFNTGERWQQDFFLVGILRQP